MVVERQSTVAAHETGAPGPSLDERGLWREMAEGNREAAEALVEGTYRMVFGSLVKLCGDADLAADLTQETYRKAWASIRRFDGRSRFSTWLYRIAYNTFLNHIRRPHRLQLLDEEQASRVPDPAETQDRTLERSLEGERTRRAVLSLPEDLRFAVTARFWGGLKLREIAQQQGISSVGVHKRLKRAFRLLEVALEEVDR